MEETGVPWSLLEDPDLFSFLNENNFSVSPAVEDADLLEDFKTLEDDGDIPAAAAAPPTPEMPEISVDEDATTEEDETPARDIKYITRSLKKIAEHDRHLEAKKDCPNVKFFLCLECHEFPRPTNDGESIFSCTNEHPLCRACYSKVNLHTCVVCNGEVKTPLKFSPLLRRIYEDALSNAKVPCYRNCGRSFKEKDRIVQHDSECKFGKTMMCPVDELEVVPYRHHVNGHNAHLHVAFPSHSYSQEVSWHRLVSWPIMKNLWVNGERQVSNILYLNSEMTYIEKKASNTLSRCTPLAMFATFEITYVDASNPAPDVAMEVCLKFRWGESEPYNTRGMPNYIEVTELKTWNDELCTKTYAVRPAYQKPPSAPLKKKTRSGCEEKVPEPFKNNLYSLRLNNKGLNRSAVSKFIPCKVCGRFSVFHTHLKFTLKTGSCPKILPEEEILQRPWRKRRHPTLKVKPQPPTVKPQRPALSVPSNADTVVYTWVNGRLQLKPPRTSAAASSSSSSSAAATTSAPNLATPSASAQSSTATTQYRFVRGRDNKVHCYEY